ncbi:ABC transporter G family member 23 isoform X2 [Folsomia candida]|nr:ABC transporter G family member 23 isoform X2 [Folsomia candida]
MPQELSLLKALSIAEVLRYFGMIYGMSSEAIDEQIKFLANFLDLPSVNSSIQNLSGGQKRRVSLAVAMIHNPPLLVLDEPTVGVDPLLRQRIWEHLTQLSKERGTTIILSTHYVEETKRCHKIGFMRNGQLLAEDNPQSLLSRYKTESLERVTLQLCRQDEHIPDILGDKDSSQFEEIIQIKSYRKFSLSRQNSWFSLSSKHSPSPHVQINHARIFYALVYKWWHRHRRDLRMALVEYFIPIMVIYLFHNIIGVPPRFLNVGVVTNAAEFDNYPSVKSYCDYNANSTNCFENIGICNFLNKFDDTEFTWIHTDSYQEALASVKLGNHLALIEFPKNFTNHLKNRMLHQNFADNSTILGSTISIQMDESNAITQAWVKKTIVEKYIQFVQDIVNSCSTNDNVIQQIQPPLEFSAIYGNVELGSFIPYMQPGLIVMLTFMLSNAVAVLWVEDRKEGLEDRDYAAGVTMMHQMASSFFTQSIHTLIESSICFGFVCGVYGMEINGSWFLAGAIVYLSAVSGTTLGWMVALVLNELIDTILIVLSITILQAFSSGLIWPIEMVVAGYRNFAKFLPTTHVMEAFRSICTRGWGLDHPVVAKGFISAACWILLSIVICTLVERRRHR